MQDWQPQDLFTDWPRVVENDFNTEIILQNQEENNVIQTRQIKNYEDLK